MYNYITSLAFKRLPHWFSNTGSPRSGSHSSGQCRERAAGGYQFSFKLIIKSPWSGIACFCRSVVPQVSLFSLKVDRPTARKLLQTVSPSPIERSYRPPELYYYACAIICACTDVLARIQMVIYGRVHPLAAAIWWAELLSVLALAATIWWDVTGGQESVISICVGKQSVAISCGVVPVSNVPVGSIISIF